MAGTGIDWALTLKMALAKSLQEEFVSQSVNFAMLGCGAVADLYLPAFKFLPEANIVAVIDIDQTM
ncbi:hypothetical protein KAH55_07315, partial [bacterium]|nr:hypothetical protein [bacterium]